MLCSRTRTRRRRPPEASVSLATWLPSRARLSRGGPRSTAAFAFPTLAPALGAGAADESGPFPPSPQPPAATPIPAQTATAGRTTTWGYPATPGQTSPRVRSLVADESGVLSMFGRRDWAGKDLRAGGRTDTHERSRIASTDCKGDRPVAADHFR